MSKYLSTLLVLILSATLLVAPARVNAAAPIETPVDAFMLPWAYGETYRITWGPYDHWASNPRLGFAVDFGLPEGTPLVAPADGEAHYLVDTRPSQYGLGNYVDLISGNWKIRLAHLLDARTDSQPVSRGDFLGYSGASGAEAAHLHVELFIWRDDAWTAAQADDLNSFMGIPLSDLVEGALATSMDAASQLVLADIPTLQAVPEWKHDVLITLPIRNTSAVETSVSVIQLSFIAEDGRSYLAEFEGAWLLEAHQDLDIVLPFTPETTGWWQLEQVTLLGNEELWRFPTELGWYIEPPPLAVVGLSVNDVVDIGAHAELELWVENHSQEALAYPALGIQGTLPDGTIWQAVTDKPVEIPANALLRLQLHTPVLLQTGTWQISWLVEYNGEHTWRLGQLEQSFEVEGPQLLVTRIGKRGEDRFYLTLTNAGTRSAAAEWADIVAVDKESGAIISGKQRIIPPLEPGESARIVFRLPAAKAPGAQYMAGGYWLEDYYYPFRLQLDSPAGARE